MYIDLSDIDAREIAHICGVTERTARGWRAGGDCSPAAARLLSLLVFGDMETLAGRDWRGWHMLSGVLVGPDGEQWDSGRLSAWWI